MAGNSDQNRPSAAQAAANQAKDFAKQKAKEQIKKMAAKKGMATALAPVLFWAAVIILIIILLTGIIAFLLTAPGLVTGKLKDYAESLGKSIISYWGADMTQMDVSEEEQYRVLDYLEQMGYDLKGYGFIDSDVDNKESSDYDAVQGVLRNSETGKISEANSYLIMLYLSSDNYVYTVKNFNPVSPGTSDPLGSFFFYMYKYSETFNIYHRFLSLFQIGILDETGMWGKGLLSIYFEAPYAKWHKGDDYSKNIIDKWFGTDTSWTNIKVDPEKKTMAIRRGWGANYYEYELDGWTGRYGMPLEFLLSVQIATLKPDLAYEMATGFNTDVLILLRDISSDSSVVSSYLTEGGKYITYEDVENTIHAFKDDAGGFITDIINWFDDNQITDEELAALQELGFEDTLTKAELKTIIDELDDANKYDFKTYVPFLSRVTDHWYRDVYFVVGADSRDALDYSSSNPDARISSSTNSNWWITTDLDYEAVTNERWTEYKKYKGGDDIPEGLAIGDYILYVYDDPTGTYSFDQVFPGTQEQANQAGIKVYKKADTGSVFDLIDKGILDEYEEGADTSIWTAYNTEDTGATSAYKRLYPDEDETTYKGKLYYKELLSNNVVQKQDALRRETNPRIKQMFLTRQYFSYDGTAPRAEAIMQVRDKIKGLSGSYKNINNVDVSYSKYLYGAIPDELLDGNGTEFTINDPETGKSETVNIKDMVSTVSLNQDSLAAFAMLENTHTEDADFIYKDFKELIVELGFFTKEDLTEGSAKLLEFPVPSIGSGGYPYRYIDKNNDVIGTKVHSKEDIEASKKLLIAYMVDHKDEDAPYLTPDPEGGPGTDDAGEINGYVNRSNISLSSPVEGLNRINQINYTNVGAVRDISAADWEFTPTGNHGRGVKTGDLSINGIEYEVWQQTVVTCTLWSFAFIAQAYTGEPQDTYCTKTGSSAYINQTTDGDGSNSYWTNGVVWSCFEQVGISGQYYFPPSTTELCSKVADALDEGKPVYFYGDYAASEDCHAVVLLGADSSGKVLIYNPGGGTMDLYGSSSSFGTNLEALFEAHFRWRIFIPDEVPTGVNRNKNEADPYVGYLGNEAVVSPVTGILLEYGVYNDEDGENGYRNNTDDVKPEFLNGPDKVGYAKILVLSNEIANQFVKVSNDGTEGADNIVKIKAPANKDEFEDWSSDEKALYGYGLFADSYEKSKVATDSTGDEKAATSKTGRYENIPETTHGIAGYIIYIDGFLPELPNEDAQQYVVGKEDEDGDYMELPDESIDLSYDVFRRYGYNIGSSDIDDKENLYTLSQYEEDKVYKMQSQTVQDREDAKAEGKKNSVNVLNWHGTVNGDTKDWVILKEGTVIGRTMSNKELMTKVRGLSNYVEPKDIPEEENAYLYGNYLRLVFKNRDDECVENIEDYMKLDEANGSNTRLVPQPYKQDPDGNDAYRLQSMLHHELCGGSTMFVNLGKVRDKSGKWRYMTKEDCETASKVTVYVCLNNAILQDCYIKEILTSGAYGSAGYSDAACTSIICPDCYEIAQWCLKYDCMSVESSEGVTMTRNCRTESAFDTTCRSAWLNGEDVLERWWLLDFANLNGGYGADGTVADYCNNECYDGFFLRYIEDNDEYDAQPVMQYNNVMPHP